MIIRIRRQQKRYLLFYALFGIISLWLMVYYLSNTLIHFTTAQQFPINSFERFPLTWLIFPAEFFSALFALYFIYSLFTDRYEPAPSKPLPKDKSGPVALLLPCYHEPRIVVERTIKACKKVRWKPGTRIYLLDDSTEPVHVKEMATLARRYNCVLVRREDRKGYKAGNVNNALRYVVKEPYFAIFDADQAPDPSFLERTMDHFSDDKVGFVQTPQYFINKRTYLERAARLGANIFFQSMCNSKSRDGALPFCGTNAVLRSDVFREVNGFSYYTSTEDIELGLRCNEAGYRGFYEPTVLCQGYAPQDFMAYASQQYRWANGNLAILRESFFNILRGPFSLRHQIHTLFTLGWWFIGIITLIYIIVPLLSLFLQSGTHHTWLPGGMFFLIYINVIIGIGMVLMSLQKRTEERVTVTDALLQYSLITNSLFIYARAAINAMLKRYVGFIRTSKGADHASWWLVKWNLLLGVACMAGSIYALYNTSIATTIQGVRTYLPLSIWLLFYGVILFSSLLFVGKPPTEDIAVVAARREKQLKAPSPTTKPKVAKKRAPRRRKARKRKAPAKKPKKTQPAEEPQEVQT